MYLKLFDLDVLDKFVLAKYQDKWDMRNCLCSFYVLFTFSYLLLTGFLTAPFFFCYEGFGTGWGFKSRF